MFRFFRERGEATPLATCRLFSGLSGRDVQVVQGFLHQRRYQAGEVIFDEGEEGQALYILLSGQVLICRQGEMESPIAQLESGSFFGEMALLDDAPRAAQARALGPVEVAVLFRGDFLNLMDDHARIASRISLDLARQLGDRLRRMILAQGPR
ncbi:cyclic nucleotide-binding domain-containing protein [Azovibrio restrictus]|uniref:cyclic nucleotide-binding domain-containing protein n=1 Tax=Azovibrio restrictus TaxID=146938 RepID=UPI0026F1A477|nr:cyclic nucleotide-binding domain-containing protein [Azovibrio restrictus]MDD3484781.1 cyclic nucleotide-binding domain-containing protein [Azovibrio restrictus]